MEITLPTSVGQTEKIRLRFGKVLKDRATLKYKTRDISGRMRFKWNFKNPTKSLVGIPVTLKVTDHINGGTDSIQVVQKDRTTFEINNNALAYVEAEPDEHAVAGVDDALIGGATVVLVVIILAVFAYGVVLEAADPGNKDISVNGEISVTAEGGVEGGIDISSGDRTNDDDNDDDEDDSNNGGGEE